MESSSESLQLAVSTSAEPIDFNFTLDNNSYHYVCEESFLQDRALSSATFQTIIYVLYCSIFFVAVLGNGIVCIIVQSSKRMRTVTNFFIMNLAVGDILMSVFCVPFSFVSLLILQHWPFGSIMCHLVNFSQAVSVLVSAYTLVAISIDRYMAIMWPLKPRLTKGKAMGIILTVWAVAIVTALPIPIVSRLDQPTPWHSQCGKVICHENWSSKNAQYYYSMALMGLQFIVPVSVLVFTYTRIAVAVWGKRPPGEAEDCRDRKMARSKRKMIKMMLTVVIVFTICWLPFNTLMVLWTNDERLGMWPAMPYVWFGMHWLAMSHSCYNPIIYCYMNARFREGFSQILNKIPCLRKCVPDPVMPGRERSSNERSGHLQTGMDDHSVLHRVNTCSTYVSMKRKIPLQCSCMPLNPVAVPYSHSRMSSIRSSYHTRRFQNTLDAYPEDQI